jgi:arylformamidase
MNLEAEYDNRARVPGHPAIVESWKTGAAAYRAEAGGRARLGLAYGARSRNLVDLFPADKPRPDSPLCVFIHGGYWRAFDPSSFSHMARGANAHGLDVAIPGYTLCPEVTLPDIVDELRQACIYLWKTHGRRLVVAGHSAGGHLAACMMATSWEAYGGPVDLVQAGFGISGLYDVRPLMATSINQTLGLDETLAILASPLLWRGPEGGRFDAWVGAEESAEYYRQSQSLVAAWKGVGRDARYHAVPGENHFSIIGALADPGSTLTRNLAELCGL